MRRDILAEYRRLGLRPISGGEGDGGNAGDQGNAGDGKPNDNANPGGNGGDQGKPAAFTAEQQAEINRLVGKAREEGRDAEKKRRDDADAEAKRKRDQDEAAARGEFDKVKADIEAERDRHKDEAAALTAQLDQYRAAIDEVVAAQWKALPKEVAEVYPGADDDPLAKLAFLAKSKALVEKLTAGAAGGTQRGNGADPKPAGGAKPANDEAARAANARRYRL